MNARLTINRLGSKHTMNGIVRPANATVTIKMGSAKIIFHIIKYDMVLSVCLFLIAAFRCSDPLPHMLLLRILPRCSVAVPLVDDDDDECAGDDETDSGTGTNTFSILCGCLARTWAFTRWVDMARSTRASARQEVIAVIAKKYPTGGTIMATLAMISVTIVHAKQNTAQGNSTTTV